MYLIVCRQSEDFDCYRCDLGMTLENVIATKLLRSVSSKEIESKKFFKELKTNGIINENEDIENLEFMIVEADFDKVIDVSWKKWK